MLSQCTVQFKSGRVIDDSIITLCGTALKTQRQYLTNFQVSLTHVLGQAELETC